MLSSITAINQMMPTQLNTLNQVEKSKDTAKGIESFGSLFEQQLQDANKLQLQADVELQQFMMGESENLHDVMIAMEEAKIALELTTQVRNKMVDAYQEIKNMQI